MATGPWVTRDFDSPHLALRCDCGWEGTDADIESWTVRRASDRAVRDCPDCERPVAEWGALRGLDGLATVARGPLRSALADERLSDD